MTTSRCDVMAYTYFEDERGRKCAIADFDLYRLQGLDPGFAERLRKAPDVRGVEAIIREAFRVWRALRQQREEVPSHE